MNASEFFKSGKLAEAIDAQIQEVKSNPGDQAKRLFLFEMLAFSGDLERARKQIEVLKFDDVPLQLAAMGYRQLLDAESKRRRLFTEGLKPEFLGDVPEHITWRLEAVNRLREGNQAEAAALVNKANAALPSLKGKLNDKPFEGIRDCDDLFGSVLEVMAQGNYFWVPLEQVELIVLGKPRFPRDTIWLGGRLEMADSKGDVFLANLYPGAHEQSEIPLKLGRSTDWRNLEGGLVRGIGAKLFLVGDDAVPLLEWRQLEIAEGV